MRGSSESARGSRGSTACSGSSQSSGSSRRCTGAFFLTSTAGVATLIYALSAGHALPVSWIAARHTLVCTAFSLLAFWLHLRAREDGWRPGRWLSPVALAVGLLGGEMTLGTVALIGAWEIFGRRDSIRDALLRRCPVVVAGGRLPGRLRRDGLRRSRQRRLYRARRRLAGRAHRGAAFPDPGRRVGRGDAVGCVRPRDGAASRRRLRSGARRWRSPCWSFTDSLARSSIRATPQRCAGCRLPRPQRRCPARWRSSAAGC